MTSRTWTFTGRILGVGTTSGVRLVVGVWDTSPLGGFADVMVEQADGLTARFYAVVSRDTVDAEFAAHRQRFLAEQGYAYRIMDAEDAVAAD